MISASTSRSSSTPPPPPTHTHTPLIRHGSPWPDSIPHASRRLPSPGQEAPARLPAHAPRPWPRGPGPGLPVPRQPAGGGQGLPLRAAGLALRPGARLQAGRQGGAQEGQEGAADGGKVSNFSRAKAS